MSKLVWVRRVGKGAFAYHTADTPLGRIRVSRVNKTGVALFRAYFWDGKQFTASTAEEAMAAAEARLEREGGK